ncbi:hypothetical protein PILCRDRAFT_478646 [Piloderma croceum F 1598]|uniref:Uncharacterized protein n=1 Tax=Piloderma croceum (strain F 1598) TaxID=765440 RepID=A0A0C3B6P5_PILCF|nr:hypothetical protein PILCRDRAFT_478646 [Piloderma croceum F 1598]
MSTRASGLCLNPATAPSLDAFDWITSCPQRARRRTSIFISRSAATLSLGLLRLMNYLSICPQWQSQNTSKTDSSKVTIRRTKPVSAPAVNLWPIILQVRSFNVLASCIIFHVIYTIQISRCLADSLALPRSVHFASFGCPTRRLLH